MLDGYKYYFENDAWLLIRLSGTEPVLRIYAQAENRLEIETIFQEVRTTLSI
jgi:phosphomannomutase